MEEEVPDPDADAEAGLGEGEGWGAGEEKSQSSAGRNAMDAAYRYLQTALMVSIIEWVWGCGAQGKEAKRGKWWP